MDVLKHGAGVTAADRYGIQNFRSQPPALQLKKDLRELK